MVHKRPRTYYPLPPSNHKYKASDVVLDHAGDIWRIIRKEKVHTDAKGITWPEYIALGPMNQAKPKINKIYDNHITQKLND